MRVASIIFLAIFFSIICWHNIFVHFYTEKTAERIRTIPLTRNIAADRLGFHIIRGKISAVDHERSEMIVTTLDVRDGTTFYRVNLSFSDDTMVLSGASGFEEIILAWSTLVEAHTDEIPPEGYDAYVVFEQDGEGQFIATVIKFWPTVPTFNPTQT